MPDGEGQMLIGDRHFPFEPIRMHVKPKMESPWRDLKNVPGLRLKF